MNAAEIIYGLSVWMPDGWKGWPPYQTKYGIGQVIEQCFSESQREACRALKSEDIAHLRTDQIWLWQDEHLVRQLACHKLLDNFEHNFLGKYFREQHWAECGIKS